MLARLPSLNLESIHWLIAGGESQPGWWKIEYQVNGGNDTTTWEVNVLGNPVHLVVP